MCLDKILQTNQEFQQQLVTLYDISPYYPEIKTYFVDTSSTIVRKENEGVWYKWLIVDRGGCKADRHRRIHETAYSVQILGKVNPKIKDVHGICLFPEDGLQQNETDRLKEVNEKIYGSR